MKRIKILAALCLALVVNGCGSASSGDDGVSFTLLGFYQDIEGDVGLSYKNLSVLSSDANDDSIDDVTAVAAVTNNLTGVYIAGRRIETSYSIAGSAVIPPSSLFPFAGVMGPVACSTCAGSDGTTTLPPSLAGNENAGNTLFIEYPVVPGSLRKWLAANRGSLPPMPFSMVANVVVFGETSAGDEIETNSGLLMINVSSGD